MTAEAIVMNKSAVAMAADSAVTITGSRRGPKTYDTANKLFELIKGRPIGVMIYASAELSGIPWETIIKAYREERANETFPHLSDYVEDLQAFLKSNAGIFDSDTEEFTISVATYNAVFPVFRHFQENLQSCMTQTGRIIQSRVVALIEQAVEQQKLSLTKLPDAAWVSNTRSQSIRQEHRAGIRAQIDEMFEKFKLKAGVKNELVELAFLSLSKQGFDEADSGLVIAGFGDKEYLPSYYSATLRGRLCGLFLNISELYEKVTVFEPSQVSTFAQDAEARAYLGGVSREVQTQILEFWTNWRATVPADARKLVDAAGLPQKSADLLAKGFSQYAQGKVAEFLQMMQRHQEEIMLGPLVQSIGLLPKDELAIVAESLVNLTSLKQRMRVDEVQTVGGAIDVALISKGDGFVWLKRKHYFQPDLNPSWALTHAGTIPLGGRRPHQSGSDQAGGE